MKKEWRVIPWSVCYEVSNYGEVRNRGNKRLLKPYSTAPRGFLTVDLLDNRINRYRHFNVARLVYEVFGHDLDRYSVVSFKNGNKHDLRLSNLYTEDITHYMKTGSQPNRIIELKMNFRSKNDCVKYLRSSFRTVRKALNDPTKTVKGYHLEKIDKFEENKIDEEVESEFDKILCSIKIDY